MPIRTVPRMLLETTAELLEVGSDPWATLRVGLEASSRLLDADRSDGGWLSPGDRAYEPDCLVGITCEPSPTFRVSLDDPVIAGVLGADHSIPVESTREQLPDGSIRSLMLQMSTRSMVVTPLKTDTRTLGLLCLDWLEPVRPVAELDDGRLELFDYFARHILSPVLARAVAEGSTRTTSAVTPPLTSAELAVVRLAAAGNTYVQIATTRGVSVNTVSQQLRAARRKAGVANTAELCALVGQTVVDG